MDQAVSFYQTLTGVSFTLLGIWFGVMQFAHGRWRSDPELHRSTLHIALHFFLPGLAGLGSLLSGSTDGGLIWRIVFAVSGLLGLIESLSFFRAPGGPVALPGRILRAADPLLYTFMIVAVFLPPGVFGLRPLQLEGITTGLLFTLGLCYVWLAFAERPSEEGSSELRA